MKNVNQFTIKKIYTKYFDIIDSFFGSIKHHLSKDKESHIDLGFYMANYPLISDLILDSIEDLDECIENFWIENARIVLDYIKKSEKLKCIYSGSVSPVILEDFIKRSCLYVDSVIIADPIYNLTIFQKQITSNKKYYLNKLLRHIFNIWKIKDLILTAPDNDILFILPINFQLLDPKDQNILLKNADSKFTEYINRITKRKFGSSEESLAFLESIKTTESVFAEIKNPDLLPNSFRDKKSFESFFIDFGATGKYTEFGIKTPGWDFGLYLKSQFIRVQEHKFFCEKLIAEPIYDDELPWFFFNYELGSGGIDSAIINSLQRNKFEWITKVPVSALSILRNENKLEYMRNLLRTSITDLKVKNDKELVKISEQIEMNFTNAFKRQKSEIKTLEKEVSDITKKEIPIITGVCLGGFLPWIGNVISIVKAGSDIKKLLVKRFKLKNDISGTGNTFINLLMKSYE
jgi:hypothetical protein